MIVHAAKDPVVMKASMGTERVRRTWCGELALLTSCSEGPNGRSVTCSECKKRLREAGVYVKGL